MNRKTTIAACTILSLGLAAVITASAGNLNPPAGPISPTGPSLSDLQSNINSIMPGAGGASIEQVTDVVVAASMGINENINDLTPRGDSFYRLFLRVDGISGTATQGDYMDFIEVTTAEIDMSVPLNSGPGGNNPGAPYVSGLRITIEEGADGNAAKFATALLMGTNVSCDLAFAQPIGDMHEVMKVAFDESFITSYEILDSGFEIEITPIKCVTVESRSVNAMGDLEPLFAVSWDIEMDMPCN